MPSHLVIEMVYAANFWLNVFPQQDGISSTLRPWSLLTGHKIEYGMHHQLKFSEYMHMHKEHDNSMQPCMIGAFTLHQTGNV